MKTSLDMGKIAAGLGAERRGNVSATGGYFGVTELWADVDAVFEFRPVVDALPIRSGQSAALFPSRLRPSSVSRHLQQGSANTNASKLNRCRFLHCCLRKRPSARARKMWVNSFGVDAGPAERRSEVPRACAVRYGRSGLERSRGSRKNRAVRKSL